MSDTPVPFRGMRGDAPADGRGLRWGVGASADADAQARWEVHRLDHYRYTWRQQSMIGIERIDVEVRDGHVVKSTVRQSPNIRGRTARPTTVEYMFAMIATTRNTADEVTVTYDETLGYPAIVAVDAIKDAIDDECQFGVEEFEIL